MTTMTHECFAIDGERLAQSLQAAGEKLDTSGGEVVLDFSSVLRIDPSALRALEVLAHAADESSVKIALRGINIEIYKVLKLAGLAGRFSFAG